MAEVDQQYCLVEEEGVDVEMTDFPLKWLPTRVLAGILKRVRPITRVEVEDVDQQLAAVARSRAWRHTHRLRVEGSGAAEDSGVRFEYGRVIVPPASIAAVYWLMQRTRITHVQFVKCGLRKNEEKQAEQSAVVVALAESPRVRLRSISFSACRYYTDGRFTCKLRQLLERHSSTLQDVSVEFEEKAKLTEGSRAFYEAVGACAGLNSVEASLSPRYCREQLAVVLRGKRLRSLALSGCSIDAQLFLDMPSPPSLEQLDLYLTDVDLAYLLDTKPEVFAKLRRLQTSWAGLGDVPVLLPVLRACPSLQVLVLEGTHKYCDEATVRAFTRAYFDMADDERTLFVHIRMQMSGRSWIVPWVALVAAWQADVAGLHMDCYSGAICAAAGLAAPVGERPEWPRSTGRHTTFQSQFVLWLHGRNRRLALSLSVDS